MAKPVEQVVNETLDNLKEKLLASPPPSEHEAMKIISICLNVAFSEVVNDEKKKLYKRLTLQLHDDKLETANPDLYHYLQSINSLSILQGELNKWKEKSILEQTLADPIKGTKSLFEKLYKLTKPMREEFKRYPQPLRFLSSVLLWTMDIALILGTVIILIPLVLTLFINSLMILAQRKLMNIITYNTYEDELEKYKKSDDSQNEARKNFYSTCRAVSKINTPHQAEHLDTLSDREMEHLIEEDLFSKALGKNSCLSAEEEEALRARTKNELEEMIKQSAKNTLPRNFFNLILIPKAIFQALKKPLPEGIANQFVSILVTRPLQLLLTPLLLVMAASLELLNYTAAIAIIVTLTSAISIRIAALTVINMPLYALDTANYLINEVKSYLDPNQAPTHIDDAISSEAVNSSFYSYERMVNRLGEPSLNASSQSTEQVPSPHTSLYSPTLRSDYEASGMIPPPIPNSFPTIVGVD